MTVLKAFRLEKKLVNRLSKLAKESHRSERFFVEEALRLYLDEIIEQWSDEQLAREARERMRNSKPSDFLDAKTFKKKFGLK